MEELLRQCGFKLTHGQGPNELICDQALFQKKLADEFSKHQNALQLENDFVEELQTYIDDKKRFFFTLQSTLAAETARNNHQDSLMQLLFGIQSLQQSVTNMLFEKMAEISGIDELFPWNGNNFSLTHLIVAQFRCSYKIVKNEELCNKILQILEIVTVETQKSIISCLPEILSDDCHPTIAKALSGYLNSYSEITASILDALSSLNITPELLSEIHESTALATAWMKSEHIPVVIRFLFHTCNVKELDIIISTLRKNLMTAVFPVLANSKQKRVVEANEQNHVVMILDELKLFIQIPSTADSWVKLINDAPNGDPQHRVVDFFVILIFHSLDGSRNNAEILLRNKIKGGYLTERFIRSVFRNYSWALKNYFNVIMAVAEKFLKYDNQSLVDFGMLLYAMSFTSFDYGYKQEVLNHLLSHFSSYKSHEVDSAIKLLMGLTKKLPEEMASFAIYIKRTIDYFDYLTLHQVRQIYSCLSLLACSGVNEGEVLQNEIQTVVQKQITNPTLKYKRMAIVGSLMLVKHLAPTSSTSSDSSNNTQRALNLLELLYSGIRRENIALGLFYDELSALIVQNELNSKIEDWINQKVINNFPDHYMTDVEANGSANPELQLGLDVDEYEGGIAVRLLELVMAKNGSKGKLKDSNQISPMNLCSHFRLLHIFEYSHNNGNLEGVDALLGCPLQLPQLDNLDDFGSRSQDEKNITCCVLFYCLNWFREVINAFATQTEPELRGKVITRLRNITHHQNILCKCLANNPGFVPPLAHFDSDEKPTTTNVVRKRKANAPIEKPAKKPKRARKSKVTQSTTETQDESNDSLVASTVGEKTSKEKTKELSTVLLSNYANHFRELDFVVFDLLKENLLVEESATQASKLGLSPSELLFLLEDLKAKLDFALSTPSSSPFFTQKANKNKQSSFANLSLMEVDVLIKKAVGLIPSLCLHLEAISGYFQNILENDDIVDTHQGLAMSTCFKFLVDSIAVIFSWSGFEYDEEEQLLNQALSSLASRLSTSSQSSHQEAISEAFQYVVGFSASVPNFSCAVGLLLLAEKLLVFNRTQSRKEKLGEMADEFLKKKWATNDGKSERGSQYNAGLQRLLSVALKFNPDPVRLLQTFVTEAFPELLKTGNESSLYPTLNKFSFTIFYRVLFQNLVAEMKKLPASNPQNAAELLLRWNLGVDIFLVLVNSVKVFGSQSNFISCLKYSRLFVETFLRIGMPLLDSLFRKQTDDVMNLLKTFQQGTRFLQHLCCHAKVIKQLSLIKLVPVLKKNLEAFLYRVKAMLALSNCKDAFWLGNLKNKNLEGKEIEIHDEDSLSEVDREENEEEEEIPEELQGNLNENEENLIVDEEELYSQSF